FLTRVQCGLGFLRRGFLFRRVEENRRAVLRTEIGPLAVLLRRIVHLPESVQQLLVCDFGRVEGYLNDFGMAGFVRANVLVGWTCRAAAAISHGRVDHSRYPSECRLNPPKTARTKCCDF